MLSRSPGAVLVVYASFAAFCTYFCMYAFRKPFAAGLYEGYSFGPLDLKSALVISQVIGYTISKYLGIKFCSEARGDRRGLALVLLILWAEAALLLFAVAPPQWKVAAIFLNGLPLGMVWGMVCGFLEGRQTSDLLLAVLSASYIMASAVVKDVGRLLMRSDILGGYALSESWMPAATGAMFLVPYLCAVWLLSQLPRPTTDDVTARVDREPMDGVHRMAFLKHFLPGMILLIVVYFFLTAYRDLRDNFGEDLFKEMGYGDELGKFSRIEIWVAIGVTSAMAMLVLIRNNRRALSGVFVMMAAGTALLGGGTLLFDAGMIRGDTWMMLTGLGAYLAYVPYGAVLFDRLIAATHITATAVFAIYLTDAVGYTGTVGVLLYKEFFQADATYLAFFRGFTYLMAIGGTVLLLAAYAYFHRQHRRES